MNIMMNSGSNFDSILRLDHGLVKNGSASSSRILDIPCKVCGDFSSGKHYNIFACDGCAGFFKRSIRRNRQYICKAKAEGLCIVDKTHRNQCRACRLAKCQEAGMNKDAVQHERGPRNSTLRRQQMAQYFNEARDRMMLSPNSTALDLALPKQDDATPSLFETPTLATHSSTFLHRFSAGMMMPIMNPAIHPLLNPATICESAARLLFMNVKWTKTVPSFTQLGLDDQLLLLEESWRELFILGASQFLPLELSTLVHACGLLEREPTRAVSFLQNVKDFQDILVKISQFHLDPHEYACLRAIVLFKTSFDKSVCYLSSSGSSTSSQESTKVLKDSLTISTIQDHTQLTLNKYISTAYPGQPLRFGKLLLLMPNLRTVGSDTIEELFFRKTIGHIPIVRIICDMYKSSTPNIF